MREQIVRAGRLMAPLAIERPDRLADSGMLGEAQLKKGAEPSGYA